MANSKENSFTLPVRPVAGQVGIITVLRGLAATSVFLFHLVCLSKGYISGKYLTAFFGYGKYGVQFFFVISGFVIPYSMMKAGYQPGNFLQFLKKRIIRIEPPYLCMVALQIIFLLVRSKSGIAKGPSELPTWEQVALHIGYLIPFSHYNWLNIVFWTLAIEFQFYLIFSLIYPLFLKNRWWRWSLSILLIGLYFYSKEESHFFYWSPIFLLGINLALVKMKKINAPEYWLVTSLLFSVVFYKLGWITGLFALTAVLAIYLEPVIRSRVLDFLGNISYSLYLSHTLIAFAIINLGIRFTKNMYQKIFFISFAIAGTLLFSYLLYYFVERPAKKWASAIRYRS
ncbi:acyltransferase family protein [Flavitalea flava]